MPTAQEIAEFIHTDHQFSQRAREDALKAAVDTLGCALAGWEEPASKKVRDLESSKFSAGSESPFWGDGRNAPADVAALVNGTASHALDYDDLVFEVTVHPSGSLWATCLSLSAARGIGGSKALGAYVRGLEVLVRVGERLGFRHYDLGWHATATLGVLGTCSASCYLLDLNRQETVHALGIAASTIGGLRRNFGSMVKPLHMGMAAYQGLRAARLAGQGFTADENVFGEGGFARAFTGGDVESVGDLTLADPLYLDESGISRKKFPCCYATHRLIQGALQLREEGLEPGSVESLEIVAPPGNLSPLDHSEPTTGLQAKFSAEYTVAEALLEGDVKLSSFEEEHVNRPPVQQLLRKIHPREEGTAGEQATLKDGVVEFRCERTDGGTVTTSVDPVPGSPRDPMTDEELRDKFEECLDAFKGKQALDTGSLYERIRHLDELQSVEELLST